MTTLWYCMTCAGICDTSDMTGKTPQNAWCFRCMAFRGAGEVFPVMSDDSDIVGRASIPQIQEARRVYDQAIAIATGKRERQEESKMSVMKENERDFVMTIALMVEAIEGMHESHEMRHTHFKQVYRLLTGADDRHTYAGGFHEAIKAAKTVMEDLIVTTMTHYEVKSSLRLLGALLRQRHASMPTVYASGDSGDDLPF